MPTCPVVPGLVRHLQRHGHLTRRAAEYVGSKRTRLRPRYWNAYQYFRIIDDVLGQAKTLARVAQAQLQLVFAFLAKSSRWSSDDISAKISRALQPAELAIELCSDIGYAPLMIRCTLNVAELRYLSGQKAGALEYWNEAPRLMNRLTWSCKGTATATLESSWTRLPHDDKDSRVTTRQCMLFESTNDLRLSKS